MQGPPYGYPGGYGAPVYRFSLGDVLAKTFSIWAKNFLPFTLITGIVQIPVLGLIIYSRVIMTNPELLLEQPFLFAGVTSGVAIGSLILGPFATACVTFGVLQQLRGRHVTVGECVRVGMSRALSVMGVAIVSGLVSGLGMLLCCVPGCIFLTGFFVAAPIAVVERLGVHSSLSRSWDLTAGLRWPVFGLIAILGVINTAAQQAISLPGNFADGMGAQVVVGIGLAIANVISHSLNAVAGAVAYHDLRTEKEGANSQDLASVFD